MTDAYICDALRTPFGRYAGALSSVRTDDLAALPIRELLRRHPHLDHAAIDDVVYGCANQSGEDNRNVGRMALLLAGLPTSVPGSTINRLCGSSLDALAIVSRAIRAGELNLAIAGGVESMSRAPFVMPKSETPFARGLTLEDTTLGWRFVNPRMKAMYGVESMGETGEIVARERHVSRVDQDALAWRSQQRAAAAFQAGRFADEIMSVALAGKRGETIVDRDEHPRADTTIEALAKLKPVITSEGTITAGNASGINDGASAILVASSEAMRTHGLQPIARVVASAVAGVEPRVMGLGPIPATRKVLAHTGLRIDQMDVIELNEAFASQALAVFRDLGVADDAAHVNPNGGAIAIGHPLGASGARLAMTAAYELRRRGGRYALCTMCIGVGQGIAMILERP